MTRRVLIIDDSKKFRNAISRVINQECPDIVVYEYDPLQEGMPSKTFNWLTYDLVLLDYRIGDENGLDWLRELKKNPDFPIVVMMTGSKREVGKKAMELGADDYLTKQKMTKSMLISTIKHVLQYAEAKRKSREMAIRETLGPSIPGYRIVQKIGQGGMSSVYLARQEENDGIVVIKTLFSESIEDETFVDRFLLEYELICKLDNPNIVKIYHQSYTEELMYMIMEYFPNGDLHQRITNSGITVEQSLNYLVKIASGLKAIHGCGIIHRDLKPSNIMFRANDTLAIIDFGISKEIQVEDELTGDDIVMGTLSYMSPESGQGKAVDARSDIYSLGIMFYEMLTGEKPYRGSGPADTVMKHARAPIPELPDELRNLQALFDIMVAKDPVDRFQSAEQLIEYVLRRYKSLIPT